MRVRFPVDGAVSGRSARRSAWRHALGVGLLALSLSGCMSSCDPAVVPMPEGYDEITFNIRPSDLVRRGATDFGKRVVVWRGTQPIELGDRGENRFRSFYEKCDDVELCDEVSFNFEQAGDDHQLTLVRFGTPLMSSRVNQQMLARSERDRCDDYKALARDLWDEPSEVELEGRMEIFEINDRYWGALLCAEFIGANLFVGRKKRIQEIYQD